MASKNVRRFEVRNMVLMADVNYAFEFNVIDRRMIMLLGIVTWTTVVISLIILLCLTIQPMRMI